MAELTSADLQDSPSYYDSPRNVGDVLVGEDNARLLIEASSSGDNTTLQILLSQPQWIKTLLEKRHCIYDEDCPSQGPNDSRKVVARRMSHLERAVLVAVQKDQASVVSSLLAFATQQGMAVTDVMMKQTIYRIIVGGQAAVFKALASADPSIINFRVGHGTMPLYEAVRRRQTDVVAVLLELGADPLHPVEPSYKLGTYHSSLMSHAAAAEDPRMIKMLLEHGTPVAHTGALHTAAHRGHLDAMRLLVQHGADVNEVLPNWLSWTSMHFAASKGQVDAIKLLEHNGARSDVKDVNGKTPAQLLEESKTPGGADWRQQPQPPRMPTS